MSQLPPGRGRRLARLVEDRPLRGGLTGIALVSLATFGVAVIGAVLVLLALLLVG